MNNFYKTCDGKKLDKVICTIEEFIDKSDDSLSVANFLLQNQFLLNPNLINFPESSIKLWKILVELLLEIDSNSNKIAAELVLNLYNSTQADRK